MGQGSLAKLGIADAGTALGSFTKAYEFNSESFAKQGAIIGDQGLRGTRSLHKNRTRTGPYRVTGAIELEPTPTDLDSLLPYILGAAESSDVFAVDETLTAMAILIDRVEKRFLYDNCFVNRGVFRFSQSDPVLKLILECEGGDETVSATAFPSITPDTQMPYIFSDAVFTLGGSTREVKDCEIVVDNQLDTERWMNSLTRDAMQSQGRLVTVRCTVPYSSANADLYAQALAGAAGTIVLTHAGYSGVTLTFAFAALQVPDNSPVISGKVETDLVLDMTARMSSSTREIIVTNDPVAA